MSEFYATQVETLNLSRSSITSLTDVPETVRVLSYTYDLNGYLDAAGIIAPTPNDVDGVSGTAASDNNSLLSQTSQMDTFMNTLKVDFRDDTNSQSGMTLQVRNAFANLFDSSTGSSDINDDSAAVYLDSNKIRDALVESGDIGSKLFSREQALEVFDAVADQGDDKTSGTGANRKYNFATGDSVNARVDVIDEDMGYDGNGNSLNSDSWIIKIIQV